MIEEFFMDKRIHPSNDRQIRIKRGNDGMDKS